MVRRHSVWVFLVALTAIFTLLSSGVAAAVTTYTDPQGRFSFTVPDGYTTFDATGIGLVGYYSPTYKGANVLVGASKSSGGSLDQVAAAVLKTVSDTLKNFQPDGNGVQPTSVAGYPAVKYGYTATVNGVGLQGLQYAFIAGGNVYFITFTAQNPDFAAFLRESAVVLSSFSVAGATGTGTAPATTTTTTAPPAGGTTPTSPAPGTAVTGPIGSGAGSSTVGQPSGSSPTTSTTAPAKGLPPGFIRRLGDG